MHDTGHDKTTKNMLPKAGIISNSEICVDCEKEYYTLIFYAKVKLYGKANTDMVIFHILDQF